MQRRHLNCIPVCPRPYRVDVRGSTREPEQAEALRVPHHRLRLHTRTPSAHGCVSPRVRVLARARARVLVLVLVLGKGRATLAVSAA